MPRKTKELLEEKQDKPKKQSDLKVTKKKAKTTDSLESVTPTKTAKTTKSKTSEISTKSNESTEDTATTKTVKTVKKKTSTSNKRATTKKSISKENTSILSPFGVEYYDLPLKYDKTVVKILYQNPTTMFVYWEISDNDKLKFKEVYGDNFFEITRPFLIIYNDTLRYHFEIEINDFANSWYFNIIDSNCDYKVELIRKPINYTENIKADSVFISSSNKIESPNDKILFSTDEPGCVYFKNTNNNSKIKVGLSQLLKNLNLSDKKLDFPIVNNIYDLYKFIYGTGEIYSDLSNPSSSNFSSTFK